MSFDNLVKANIIKHIQQKNQTGKIPFVIVNYNSGQAQFQVADAIPRKIKRHFGIRSGILEATQNGNIHKELDDDNFEPSLIGGEYELAVIQIKLLNRRLINASTEDEGV